MKGFHRTHSIVHRSDPAAGTPPEFFSFEQTKNHKPKPHLSLLANSIPPTTADNNLVKAPAEAHEPKKVAIDETTQPLGRREEIERAN
jgi:hypothetical protein